jgi:hypothetical protein
LDIRDWTRGCCCSYNYADGVAHVSESRTGVVTRGTLLCRLLRSNHRRKSATANSATKHSAVERSLSDWVDCGCLITAVPGLVIGAFVAPINGVVASNVRTVDTETVASNIGSIKVTTEHQLRGCSRTKRIVSCHDVHKRLGLPLNSDLIHETCWVG